MVTRAKKRKDIKDNLLLFKRQAAEQRAAERPPIELPDTGLDDGDLMNTPEFADFKKLLFLLNVEASLLGIENLKVDFEFPSVKPADVQ